MAKTGRSVRLIECSSFPCWTAVSGAARIEFVFKSRKDTNRDLQVPSEVEKDTKAKEVLRAWVANGGLVCNLRPETWEDASSWGIVLADVARHVANAVKELKGLDSAATVERIKTVFNSELQDPTDEPTGHFDTPRN